MVESWPVFEKGQGCIRSVRTALVCSGALADASNREQKQIHTWGGFSFKKVFMSLNLELLT